MTRENGLELRNALRVRLLDTAQELFIQIRRVAAVAVHAALHARVHAGGIAAPHIPVQVADRLAGFDVHKLAVHYHRDAGLVVADVGADKSALDPEGADFAFWGEDADGVLGEEVCFRGGGGYLEGGVVRGVHDAGCVSGVEEGGALAVGFCDGGAAGCAAGGYASAFQVVCALAEAAFGVVEEGFLCGWGSRAFLVDAGVGD